MTEISNWTFKEVGKYGLTGIELRNTVTGYWTHATLWKKTRGGFGIGYDEANIEPITEEVHAHVRQLLVAINGLEES